MTDCEISTKPGSPRIYMAMSTQQTLGGKSPACGIYDVDLVPMACAQNIDEVILKDPCGKGESVLNMSYV